MIMCSVGVCVYNEEQNIGKLLDSVFSQKLKKVLIKEIIFIISGSTDKTATVVKSYQRKYKLIKIFSQKERKGKASAVNFFLSHAQYTVLVLLGGDIILDPYAIEKLVVPFGHTDVGMTGAHPIPINAEQGFWGFAGKMVWDLHHRLSLHHPKMGEIIAFRKIFTKIPISSSVDEANIEPLIKGQGYRITYIPSALVYNKTPTNLKDFFQQRRRIFSGHLAVKSEQGYQVSTMHVLYIIPAIGSFIADNLLDIRSLVFIPVVIILESISRLLGFWDFKVAKKSYTVWDSILSTKKLV